MTFKLISFMLTILLLAIFPHNSLCGICDLCVCTRSETSRIVNCEGNREIDNYTEIFDILAVDGYNVEKLILTKHDIVTLPLDAFRGLKQLKSLDLSYNSIIDIEADVFEDLSYLEELNFSFNQISALNGAVFKNVQSLLKLNLSNNQIADLDDTTPNQLPILTHLDLSHNDLSSIGSNFLKSLENLKFLDVSFNQINNLYSEAMPQLRSLRELRATNNKLTSISGEYFPETLECLDVGSNNISSLPPNLFQVRELRIQDNNIASIDEDTSWLGELSILNISGNALTDFPNAKFANLTILDLSRNQLTIIPNTLNCDNLPILKELTIGGNPLKDLFFESKLRLQKLFIRGLDLLESIEVDAFRNVSGVDDGCVDLIISENHRLNAIENGTFDDMAICFLDLSKNAFTRITPGVLKSRDKYVAKNGINLEMNPFNCDCKAQWMLNDLVPHLYTIDPELLEDLRCNTPTTLSGTRMVHWFKWKEQVFCDKSPQVLSKMKVNTAAVLSIGDGKTVRLESSRGMLAVVAASMGSLCILMIIGIMVARRIGIRKRRMNRRF